MTAASPRRSSIILFPRLILLAALMLGIMAAVVLLLPDPAQRALVSDAIGPVVEVLAAASLLLAAVQAAGRSKREALAWGMLGTATLLYACGDGTWAFLENVLRKAPFPSAADAFYLAYYPVFLAAVLLLTRRPLHRGVQIKTLLDLATILAAGLLACWNFLLGPILQSRVGAPALTQVILLAYPVGDLVLLGALLRLVYTEAEQQDLFAAALLFGGIVLMIVGDSIYVYRALQGTYVSGGLLDLSWIAANVLIGLAGASQWAGRRALPRPAKLQGQLGSPDARDNVRNFVPYFWIAGSLVLLILRGLRPLPMSYLGMSLSVALIMGLVLSRQVVTLIENGRLNRQLRQQGTKLQTAVEDLTNQMWERQRIQEQLSHDALHDGLTGLANRTMFVDHLGLAIQQSKRNPGVSFAVLFMDLDQFKVVNDSLGHGFGDQLLIAIGRRLKQALRASDTVARLGGDEFGCLFPEVEDEAAARALADKIHAALAEPFQLGERAVHITASIGIAMDVTKYDRPQDFLRDADLAMYQAKARGKAHSDVFSSEMRTQANARLQMEEEVRGGLARREFRIYYQPIDSLKSGEIVGFEALLRWMHPVRGLLLPTDFLQIAEESGLIVPLGEWVLEQACRQMKAWQQQYPDLEQATIGVNMSIQQFSQPNLGEKIAETLRVSGLEGRYLRLEIAERALVGRDAMSDRVITALSDLRVQLQVDDFWTGSSALAYLQRFPVQALKMDRSFVRRMMQERQGLGFVRAIVSLATELGIDSVAEGIETQEQLDELKALSCGFGQGYLLAEPMDAASMGPVLAAQQPRNRGVGGSATSAADQVTRPHRRG